MTQPDHQDSEAPDGGPALCPLRVLVFTKAPVPGQVKTRLASRLGARGAARVYRHLTWEALATASRAEVGPVELWGAPSAHYPFFLACRRRFGVRLRRQSGADLGQRMDRAIRQTDRTGGMALIMGADAPSLTVMDLQAAADALQGGAEVVVGPAQDGGYVLIGMRRPHPELFRAMPWGTAAVMGTTRGRLARLGLSWHELPVRWDVDRPADLRRWRESARG
jgi:rSAM/selenodomain-associated transferase 1